MPDTGIHSLSPILIFVLVKSTLKCMPLGLPYISSLDFVRRGARARFAVGAKAATVAVVVVVAVVMAADYCGGGYCRCYGWLY